MGDVKGILNILLIIAVGTFGILYGLEKSKNGQKEEEVSVGQKVVNISEDYHERLDKCNDEKRDMQLKYNDLQNDFDNYKDRDAKNLPWFTKCDEQNVKLSKKLIETEDKLKNCEKLEKIEKKGKSLWPF